MIIGSVVSDFMGLDLLGGITCFWSTMRCELSGLVECCGCLEPNTRSLGMHILPLGLDIVHRIYQCAGPVGLDLLPCLRAIPRPWRR